MMYDDSVLCVHIDFRKWLPFYLPINYDYA